MSASEHAYLDLLRQVLEHGSPRLDRTGVGTRSTFGALLRFDVSERAPILTTKRVFWKAAVREMLWFLTGDTNINSSARIVVIAVSRRLSDPSTAIRMLSGLLSMWPGPAASPEWETSPNLVARTTWSRWPLRAFPTSSSLVKGP